MYSRGQRLTSAVCYVFALGLCALWVDFMGHGEAFVDSTAATSTPIFNSGLYFPLGMVISCVLLVCLWRPIETRRGPLLVVAGLIGMLSAFGFAAGIPALSIVCVVLTGAAFDFSLAMLLSQLSDVARLPQAAGILTLAFALKSIALIALDQSITGFAAIIVLALMPLGVVVFGLVAVKLQHAFIASTSLPGLTNLADRELKNKSAQKKPSQLELSGPRTTKAVVALILVVAVAFAATRAASSMGTWGHGSFASGISLLTAIICSIIFIILCLSTLVHTYTDVLLRFLPPVIMIVASYSLLGFGLLPQLFLNDLGVSLFAQYADLYAMTFDWCALYFCMLIPTMHGLRIYGVQGIIYAASLIVIVMTSSATGATIAFASALVLFVVLVFVLIALRVAYDRDQIAAIRQRAAQTVEKPDVLQASVSTEVMEDAIGNLAKQMAQRLHLTDRECEILALLIAGRSRAFIADKLGIAIGTVSSHIARIYDKANVSSKQELLSMAFNMADDQ